MNSPVKLEEFVPTSSYTLIIAVSYEARGIVSLERIASKFVINDVLLICFDVDNYLSDEDLANWKQQKMEMVALLKKSSINYRELNLSHKSLVEACTLIDIDNISMPVIVDITTFPKNYILFFARLFDFDNTLFLYTRGDFHRIPDKDEKYIGITQIIPIDGFEGVIDIEKEDVVVLILGYEGNRAFSFLSDFSSNKIVALIGTPNVSPDVDQQYITYAKHCNEFLLNNSVVQDYLIDSYDHFDFLKQFKKIIHEFESAYNICLAPIGTKAETLGLFLYWKENPKVQILYPVPNKRINIAVGTGDTLVYSLHW